MSPEQFPAPALPEIAFLGRSNVGKSTLLNRLTGNAGLAHTSSTPGRTQAVNFFEVDGKYLFVDLPGYGFARAPRSVSQGWARLIESYLGGRDRLALCLLLLDARRGWMESDLQLREWLEHHGRNYAVVATKVDKLNQKERSMSRKAIGTHYAGDVIWFSGLTGQGVNELWQTITKTTRK